MEHWLPLFEDKLSTLFDHLSDDDLIVREANADSAFQARAEALEDYFANRERAMVAEPGSYRPLKPTALYLAAGEWKAAIAERPIHLATPFREPESDTVLDFVIRNADASMARDVLVTFHPPLTVPPDFGPNVTEHVISRYGQALPCLAPGQALRNV